MTRVKSHRTSGAARAESSSFELCRVVTEVNEVKSQKSKKESLPCREVIKGTQILEISQICPLAGKGMGWIIVSPAAIAERAEIIIRSRR